MKSDGAVVTASKGVAKVIAKRRKVLNIDLFKSPNNQQAKRVSKPICQ